MRFISFIIFMVASTIVSPLILFPLAVVYAMRWCAYELIFVGVCIDVYFGASVVVPYYTITAASLVFIAECIKPKLFFYST